MLALSVILAVTFCSGSAVNVHAMKVAPKGLDGPSQARLSGTNFVMSHDKPHNTREYRVFYGGVVGMETVMRHAQENDLYYRQVSDGRKLLKLVYAGKRGLIDCDINEIQKEMDTFLSEFVMKDPNSVTPVRRDDQVEVSAFLAGTDTKNSTYQILDEQQHVPIEPYATLADLPALHSECAQLHHRLRHAVRAKDRTVPTLMRVSQKAGTIPHRLKRQGRSRQRRSTSLLMPDTMWCGVGDASEGYEEVGESRGTDRCCRDHDHCPHYIEAFSSKFNLFNYYFHTISHCYCDEVFRTCLKRAGTSKAEMVGEVFFDILGMKCFEFETEDVCVERNWWGTCRRYEQQLVAHIRGSLDWD